MQSTGKELPAVSCVGYNRGIDGQNHAGSPGSVRRDNLQKAKVERLSLHMQVFGKRRGNRNEEKRNRKSGGAGNSCIL